MLLSIILYHLCDIWLNRDNIHAFKSFDLIQIDECNFEFIASFEHFIFIAYICLYDAYEIALDQTSFKKAIER